MSTESNTNAGANPMSNTPNMENEHMSNIPQNDEPSQKDGKENCQAFQCIELELVQLLDNSNEWEIVCKNSTSDKYEIARQKLEWIYEGNVSSETAEEPVAGVTPDPLPSSPQQCLDAIRRIQGRDKVYIRFLPMKATSFYEDEKMSMEILHEHGQAWWDSKKGVYVKSQPCGYINSKNEFVELRKGPLRFEPKKITTVDGKQVVNPDADKNGQQTYIEFKVYPNWIEYCQNKNALGFGVYYLPNIGNGFTEKNIDSCPWTFFEIDDATFEEQQEIISKTQTALGSVFQLIIKTTRSYHVYARLQESLKGKQGIRVWRELAKGFISVTGSDKTIKKPNQLMRFPGFDCCTYDIDTGEILRVPAEIVQYEPHAKQFTVEEITLACGSSLEKVKQDIAKKFAPDFEAIKDIDLKHIARALKNLAQWRAESYDDFLNVGLALHHATKGSEEGLNLWDEWSQQTKVKDQYEEGLCETKWAGFKDDGDKLIKAGSLFYWAREDAVEAFYNDSTVSAGASAEEGATTIPLLYDCPNGTHYRLSLAKALKLAGHLNRIGIEEIKDGASDALIDACLPCMHHEGLLKRFFFETYQIFKGMEIEEETEGKETEVTVSRSLLSLLILAQTYKVIQFGGKVHYDLHGRYNDTEDLANYLNSTYGDRLTFNEIGFKAYLDGKELDHLQMISNDLSKHHGMIFPRSDEQVLRKAVGIVTGYHKFNPIRDFALQSRQNKGIPGASWDGVDRVKDLVRAMGADENDQYNLTIVWKQLKGAMARAISTSAIKLDTMLILKGPQGYFKSTVIRLLGMGYTTELNLDSNTGKDLILAYHANWLMEFPEVDTFFRGIDYSHLKAITSTVIDSLRRPYGRETETHIRHCAFFGTTNQDKFLVDETGSRRFWILEVMREGDTNWLRENVEQVWHQVVAELPEDLDDQVVRDNCEWWLSREDDEALAERNEEYQEDNDLTDIVGMIVAGMDLVDVIDSRRLNTLAKALTPKKWVYGKFDGKVVSACEELGLRSGRPRVNGKQVRGWLITDEFPYEDYLKRLQIQLHFEAEDNQTFRGPWSSEFNKAGISPIKVIHKLEVMRGKPDN